MYNYNNIIVDSFYSLKSSVCDIYHNINEYEQQYIENKFIQGLAEGTICSLWPLVIAHDDYHKIAGNITGAGLQFASISTIYENWPNQITHGLVIAGFGLIGELYLQYNDSYPEEIE